MERVKLLTYGVEKVNESDMNLTDKQPQVVPHKGATNTFRFAGVADRVLMRLSQQPSLRNASVHAF